MKIVNMKLVNSSLGENFGKTTTVGELVEALKKISPEYEVWTEGYDCTGRACSIEINDEMKSIEIMREYLGE